MGESLSQIMRTLRTIATSTTLLLVACSTETVAQPPPAPVNWESFARPVADAGTDEVSAKERALAQEYTKALGAPGFAGLAALLDDDAHFSFPGMEDAHGRDSVARAHEVLFSAFDGRRFVNSRVWRTANEQTAEWTMTGVQTKDWKEVPASQKPVVISGLTLLWTKDDGTISDCHVYFDVAAVKAQLGAGPKALAGLAAPPAPTGATQVVDQTGHDGDNTAIVKTALDALENSNEAAYLASFADHIELHTLERADPARGKDDAARAYFKSMHKAIGQLDTTVDNGWSVGPFAIVEYSIAGEQLAPIGWVPVQKEPHVARLQVADVAEIRDGKIARIWRYDNPSQILAPGP
jgi:steroid delta-isomerase-like uncharacterized protein